MLPFSSNACLRHDKSARPFQRKGCFKRSPLQCFASSQKNQVNSSNGGSRAPLRSTDIVALRSEVEAPFRAVRFLLFGFSVVSAGVASLISIPQLIGALGGAPNALPLNDVLTNIAVDVGAVAIFGFFLSRDWQAREKQVARLGREEALANLQLEMANGRVQSVGAFRGAARIVVLAGTNAQVMSALAAAEPFKDTLMSKGVYIVAAPVYGGSEGDQVKLPTLQPSDLRWCSLAKQFPEWQKWFDTQLSLSSTATSARGLYVSLRMDGRVRGSGMGCPPWEVMSLQLPPSEGAWSGFMDGFDGKVSAE